MGSSSTSEGTRDRSTPAALRAEWLARVGAGDAEGLRPLLAPDYEVWAHGAPPLQGADATVAAMRAALTRFHIEQRFDAVETVVSGEWAFERGLEHMDVTPIGGGATQRMTQRALLILRRGADGQWQYARGVTNGLPPGASPATLDAPHHA